jgi:two-component sensor histidine kinase
MQIDEKKFNDIFDKKFAEQREEFQRHTGALAEEFASQTKTLAEISLGIQGQLRAIRDMVAQNTEDIVAIKSEQAMMRKDVRQLKRDITIVKSDITIIKNDVKQKVGLDEFSALERRVIALESA